MRHADDNAAGTVDLSPLGGRDALDPSAMRLDLNIGASSPALPLNWERHLVDGLRQYGQEDAAHLREQIARVLHERHGCEIDAGHIALGAGSMALLRASVEDTIATHSPIILSVPGYAGFRRLCEALGANTIIIPRTSSGGLDTEAIITAAREAPRPLIAMNHPVNPTGTPERMSDIATLLEALPNAVILVDEAYEEYSDSPSSLESTDTWDRVIIVRTFSKARGMAGLRLGYAVTSPSRAHRWMAQQHPGAISRVTQSLALLALEEPTEDFAARVAETVAERERVADVVRSAWQVEPLPSQGNFLLVPLDDRAEMMRDSLARQGVLVRLLLDEPGVPPSLRISIGAPQENDRLIAAMTGDTPIADRQGQNLPWPRARTFCQFIGWPRSGTTLLAALLDAHPDVDITHEADVSMAIANGCGAYDIAELMAAADRRFESEDRQWFGYDYRVTKDAPMQATAHHEPIVVGDKKAGGTAEVLALHPDVLDRTSEVLDLPVRLIVVARDPFDTIATISRHLDGDLPPWFQAGDNSVDTAIDWYFLLANVVQRVVDDPGTATHLVRFADLVADPRGEISKTLRFLNVDRIEDGYLAAVEQHVFAAANRPSQDISWTTAQRERINNAARRVPIVAYAMEPSP